MMMTSTAIPTDGRRLDYLDGLRAIAALLVLVNHAYQQIYWTIKPVGLFAHVAPWLGMGHASVILFIVLSGFCLMRPVVLTGGIRGGIWGFYGSRARRILPAYWAAMAFALLLIFTVAGQKHGAMFDLSLNLTWPGFWAHLFLIHNLWPAPYFGTCGNPEICSVFWSVAVEWQIYLFFPLFVFAWLRYGPLLTLCVICLIAWDGVRLCPLLFHLGLNGIGLNADFYAYFAFGMLAATVAFSAQWERWRDRLPWLGLSLLLLSGFIALYSGLSREHPRVTFPQIDAYCAPFFACLLIAASRTGRLQRVLSWRPLAFIGTFSFSIYLLHLPLVAVLTDYVVQPLESALTPLGAFLLLLGISLPLVLGVAYGFSRIFENKHIVTAGLRAFSKETQKRDAALAASPPASILKTV